VSGLLFSSYHPCPCPSIILFSYSHNSIYSYSHFPYSHFPIFSFSKIFIPLVPLLPRDGELRKARPPRPSGGVLMSMMMKHISK
jgi:hypothetical protein